MNKIRWHQVPFMALFCSTNMPRIYFKMLINNLNKPNNRKESNNIEYKQYGSTFYKKFLRWKFSNTVRCWFRLCTTNKCRKVIQDLCHLKPKVFAPHSTYVTQLFAMFQLFFYLFIHNTSFFPLSAGYVLILRVHGSS